MTDDPGRQPADEPDTVRFEVEGRAADRDLVQALARRLVQDDAEARRLRDELSRAVRPDEPSRRGGILAALRRSPMVGADLDLTREVVPERNVEL